MAASPNFPGLPSDWKEEIHSFENDSLVLRIWSRDENRTGRGLYVVHGFGEQSDRYLHFPHFLQTSVDVIAAVDLPGHGLSKGQRGHCDRFSEITEAAVHGFHAFEDWLSQKNRALELHWFGHSFGGLTSVSAFMAHADLPIRSAIISAPLFAIAMPVPLLKKYFGLAIEPILPRLPLENEIDNAKLSRDPSVGLEYRRNRLNHSKITPRMFVQMNREMDRVCAWEGPLPYSTMMIVPLADEIVSWKTAVRLFQKWPTAAGKKKELATWPAATHESFNDLDRARVFNAIEAWIQKN
jgi:lysophospholipase